jgi:transposase
MFPMMLLDKQSYGLQWKQPILKIGMDGKAVSKHKCINTITNLDKNSLIGFIPPMSQKKLIQELLKIDKNLRESVQEVALDMDAFYITVARKCFPNARIVTDHFHVIQWGNILIDQQRRILQQLSNKKFKVKQLIGKPAHKLTESETDKLNICFDVFPELKRSWNILQQLRKIYWQKNWKKGSSQLRKVIWMCHQSCIPEMKQLAKTLNKHRKTILNYYYISKTTNAYTEGIHNRFETIRRDHCGVRNLERFAKRLLFCFLPFSSISQAFLPQVF